MTKIIYIKIEKLKTGLFGKKKAEYEEVCRFNLWLDTEEEANAALKAFEVPFVGFHNDVPKIDSGWLNTMTLWGGTMHKSKTLHKNDLAFTILTIPEEES